MVPKTGLEFFGELSLAKNYSGVSAGTSPALYCFAA
jgi:hypothetical protein